MKTRLFVYGSLKRGRENHAWIQAQTFVGDACTLPLYRLYDLGGYPGLIASTAGLSIQGEVWEVDEAGLMQLDVLEDTEGGEYARVLISLAGDFAKQQVEGYLYLHNIEGRRDVGACW